MQYADVAVARRLGAESELLTYTIPPELLPDIHPGSVIEVPFRAAKARGVVVTLRAHVPDSQLKSKLRPIRRIISPWPLLGAQELELRKRVGQATNSSVHQTTTLLLPPPSLYTSLTQPAAESTGVGTYQFIIGNYQAGLTKIQAMLEEKINEDKGVLFLTATKALSRELRTFLAQHLPATPITQFEPGSPVTTQRLAWQIALGTQPGIVVGTRSAIFLPFRRLGLIVILDPADRQFQEEQMPRYETVAVAELRRQMFGTDIVALGPLPPLAFFTPKLRKTLTITRAHQHQPTILISTRNRPRVLQETTIEHIKTVLATGKKVAVVVPRRGWAAGLVCQECGTVIHCPTCGHLLHVINATSGLRCAICRTDQHETRCPACTSPRLTTFGWGSERFVAELQQRFVHVNVVTDDLVVLPKRWQMLVTTFDRLSRSLVTADLIIAVEPERSLLTADYRAMEHYLRHLYSLRQRAANTLILETRLPDQIAFQELQSQLPRATLTHELALRKQHGYPPYGTLLTLVWPEVTARAHARTELIARITALLSPRQLIGPSQFTTKTGQTAQRLLIKLPSQGGQKLVYKILEILPADTRWRIEH